MDDGVERERTLASPIIANDQLALAAADRQQRVDDRTASVKRAADRRTVDDGW